MTNGGGPGHGVKPKRKTRVQRAKGKSTVTARRRRAWVPEGLGKEKNG